MMKKTIIGLAFGIALLSLCLLAFGTFQSEASIQKDQADLNWKIKKNRTQNRLRNKIQLNQAGPNENLWAATYGGEAEESNVVMIPSSDGHIIMGGITESFNSIVSLSCPWVQKIDSESGAVLWQVTLETPRIIRFYLSNIYPTDDGGCWTVGSIPVGSVYMPYRFRLSSDGKLVDLPQIYDLPIQGKGYSIDVTSEGETFLTGLSWVDRNMLSWDHFITKQTSEDTISWNKVYRGPGDNHSAATSNNLFHSTVKKVDENRVILLINTDSYGLGKRSLLLVCIDSTTGNDLWKFILGGDGEEQIWKGSNMYVYKDPVDNKMYAVVACSTTSFGDNKDMWILRIDLDERSIKNQVIIGGLDTETLHSITPTQDGGCFVVGNTTNSFGNSTTSIWAFVLEPDFKTIKWEYTYGKEGEYYGGRSGFQAENGGFVIGGTTSEGRGKTDYVVIKVSEYGELAHGCSLNMIRTNARIEETSVIPLGVEVPSESFISSLGTNSGFVALPISSAVPIKICGKPHPPENLQVEATTNRNLTRGERINTITWKNSQLNAAGEVEKFRIYWKFADEGDEEYEVLAEVPFSSSGNTYEYKHEQLDSNEKYDYVVAAVDSNGIEGPWSDSIGNE